MPRFKFDAANGLILCKAKVVNRNYSAFVKLAVDTGASRTLISTETALAIGINPTKSSKHIEITTASGIVLTPLINIPSFSCFGIEIKNLEVVCHSLPPESPVDGLLGINFLATAKIIINFSENIIVAP